MAKDNFENTNSTAENICVRKAEFVSIITEKTGMKKSEAEKFVNTFVETMTELFCEGKSINFPKFGTFEASKKESKTIRSFNKETFVPAKIGVKFSPSKTLKEKLILEDEK